MNGGQTNETGEDDSSRRNLPSELKHRPKLPRTPHEGQQRPKNEGEEDDEEDINRESNQAIVMPPIRKKNGEPVTVSVDRG